MIQDGGSFAVKDALREHDPGRFKKQNPAAEELHVTMNLLDESEEKVTLTADKAPERPHPPSPETLRDDLLLADRGYMDGDCGVGSETLSGSNDAGIARGRGLDAEGGDVCTSWIG